MKRHFLLPAALMAGLASMFGASKAPDVNKIEPPCWWVGMKNDTLQLLVSGPEIGITDASISYPGISLTEQVTLDSPNYKILYLTVAPDTRPGLVPISFTNPGKKGKTTVVEYPLLQRDRHSSEYKGFNAEDVLYLLMPDRFAQGGNPVHGKEVDRSDPNARHGGNIAGIRERIPYLDSLGVTALWVCPVLENDMPGGSYHGYATTDYYRIDPRFGTNDEWNQLIADAHSKGLKVVMDMIFNHCGSSHPWLKDMPSRDWLNNPDGDVLTNFRLTTVHDPYVSDYDHNLTVNGWFVKSMPDLNQRNPHVMKYLTQNSIWWIENSKIDGIRMDTYPYADMQAMSGWAKEVLNEYPDFNIVGECWYGNEAGGAFWQRGNRLNPVETNLPTVMDFWFIINGRKAFGEETDPWNGLNKVYDHLAQDFLYPDPQSILTFLDNHDSDRFLLSLPETQAELDAWKQAQTFLLTSRGIPQIYYGTEILMNGSKEGSDGFVRLDFPGGFPGDETNAFTPEGRTPMQNEAWNFLSKILNWRRGAAGKVIAHGSLKHFMPTAGVYTYLRKLGDKEIIVMLNGTSETKDFELTPLREIIEPGSVWNDIVSEKPVKFSESITLSPRQILILENGQ